MDNKFDEGDILWFFNEKYPLYCNKQIVITDVPTKNKPYYRVMFIESGQKAKTSEKNIRVTKVPKFQRLY